MSQLPILAKPRVEVPTSTATIVSRNTLSPETIRSNFPKVARPAPLTASTEYKALNKRDKVSSERKTDDILRGCSVEAVPAEEIPKVVVALKERKRQFILKGDYDTAQRIEDAIGKLNSIVIQRRYQAMKNAEIRRLELKLGAAEQSLKNTIRNWNGKVREFNKTQTGSSNRLERIQFAKVNEFDSLPNDVLPPAFRKASPMLLDMREREKHMVLTKRYEEAMQLHRQADKREKKEAEEQKRRFIQKQQRERAALIDTQSKDVGVFRDRWTRNAQELQRDMEKNVMNQQMNVEHIKQKIRDAQSEKFD